MAKNQQFQFDTETMLSMTNSNISSNKNPWEHESLSCKNSKEALILAEQMGIKTLQDEGHCAKTLAELPSSKFIALQREITGKKQAAIKLKKDVASHKRHEQFDDVLNLDIIEKRINMIKVMSNDLDSVLRNKDKLITRLQTPFVGDFIKVDADFHKYVFEVLSDLVPSIINIGPYLDNITWAAYRDLSAGITEPMIVEIQSLVASLQTSYQTLNQMKMGIQGLSQKPEEVQDMENIDSTR